MKSFKAIVRMTQLMAFSTLAAGLLCLPLKSHAAGETKLMVTATVTKHASLQVLAQPSSVVVTAADLARGYVDVPGTSQVAIQSNTVGGYMLEFASQGDFMRQILVKGLGGVVQLSPEGGLVTQNAASTGVTKTTLALGFRFLLSESAQAGTYAWPMRLSVIPL
jgi:hypothetical protein